ncbi:MAG: leucine-rich repeat domain-containing protein [Clostridia bacterium]|nr:leucine-rich repeat domain-containing protein [Clostridia bacterium]
MDIPDTVYTIGRYADWVGICYSSTFANCTSLEYIKLPSTLQFIGTKMFSGCSSLTSIIIPIYSVYRIYSDAFEGCDNLTIYCEAESKPTGWDSNWNGDRPVVWGYKAS